MSRITGVNGADADSHTVGEVAVQLQLVAIIDFLQTFIPGFEDSYPIETSDRLVVRESRRLAGTYVVSGMDVIGCREFPDTVCHGYYIIDIHDPSGKLKAIGGRIQGDPFEVPFRTLCSVTYDNLLAAGRCVSCDHVAAAAIRIQGTCILTVQAAGIACTVAAAGVAPCTRDTAILRTRLADEGVFL